MDSRKLEERKETRTTRTPLAVSIALAAVVIALLYPLYLDGRGGTPRAPSTEWGAGLPVLDLPAWSEGAPIPRSQWPELRLAPHQSILPVRLDADLPPRLTGAEGSVPPRVHVTVALLPGGKTIWEHRTSASRIRDRSVKRIRLLLPAALLETGTYRIQVRTAEDAVLLYTSGFRVIS